MTLAQKIMIEVLNFEDVYHVRISKYKKILQKFIFKFGLKRFLRFKKVKITVPQTYVVGDLNAEKLVGIFYEKEMKITNQAEFRIEKII